MQIKDGIVSGIFRVLGKLKAKHIEADTITGNLSGNADSATTLTGLTSTIAELNHTDGVTSNIQVQLDSKAASSHNHNASNITSGTLSTDRLPTIPISKGGTGATTAASALTNFGLTATASELNYMDGVTSNVQTQLNGKLSTSGKAASATVADSANAVAWANVSGKPSSFTPASHTHDYAGSSSAGGAATSANKLNTNAGSATQPVYFANGVPVATTYTLGASVPADAKFTDTNTNTTYTLTKSGSTITLTGSDGSTTSVADANTTYSLSSFGITATTTELNYTDGVTSNIQTQLNGKAPAYSYGTSDLTAGSSSLKTGRLYFVYE